MSFSRRKFLFGLSVAGGLAGASVPVYYAQRELRRLYQEHEDEQLGVTPGEATAAPADIDRTLLANQLRGIWEIEFIGIDKGLHNLPVTRVELLLDVGVTGRAIRGYLDTAENLRSNNTPAYQVIGDIAAENLTDIRWRLVAADSPYQPAYEFTAIIDEVWGLWGDNGITSLSGNIRNLDRPLDLPEKDCQFVARKRPFPFARERIRFNEQLSNWLVSPAHRLFHQLWHASRDKWHELSETKRNALRGFGWQPGPLDKERDARGKLKHRNGSGEDFFFMHRHMLNYARQLQPDLKSWLQLPLPAPYIEYDRVGFIRYHENHDGCSVPPAWNSRHDAEYTKWLLDIKGQEVFYSNFQVWESQYRDPEYLAKMTLGEFGSEMELGLHDWIHMRWATITHDPTSEMPISWNRWPTDFSSRWFLAENDFLGDPFSSHVNPVFWSFHGWIDDRIEDWFRAHERMHPGQVVRREVNGVNWFAKGRWVELDEPWLGPTNHSCAPGEQTSLIGLDNEQMKVALGIALSEEDDVPELIKRAPRRPWYARNMKNIS